MLYERSDVLPIFLENVVRHFGVSSQSSLDFTHDIKNAKRQKHNFFKLTRIKVIQRKLLVVSSCSLQLIFLSLLSMILVAKKSSHCYRLLIDSRYSYHFLVELVNFPFRTRIFA